MDIINKEVEMEIYTHNETPVKVLIDDEDFEKVSKYKWRKYPSCRYVQSYINGKTVSISRFIVDAKKGQCVDHINGNRLDNRKSNLRICSQAMNMKNRKPNINGKSCYKGIILLPNGKYRAKINNDGKRYELGVYQYERDAVIAYNAASKVLHGEFSYMNEIPTTDEYTRAQSPRQQAKAYLEELAREAWGDTVIDWDHPLGFVLITGVDDGNGTQEGDWYAIPVTRVNGIIEGATVFPTAESALASMDMVEQRYGNVLREQAE